MCLANAKRDDYILLPIEIPGPQGEKKFWEPLTGETTQMSVDPRYVDPTTHSIKHLKGRSRKIVVALRASKKAEAIVARRKQPASSTPDQMINPAVGRDTRLGGFRWQNHCGGLFQLPVAG